MLPKAKRFVAEPVAPLISLGHATLGNHVLGISSIESRATAARV